MKQISILSGKAHVIEMPEGATNPEVHTRSLTFDTPMEVDEWGYDYQSVKLPPGNWRIIGMLSEVREGEAGEVIDEPFVDNLVALEVAITSEGFMFSGDECLNQFCYNGKIDMGYGEFTSCEICDESRVLCRERCLLLGREG